MLLIFAVAAGVGIYHCVVRKPELKKPVDEASAQSAKISASTVEESGGRKKDFYTILLSGEDDGNGGSDTNILVGFDAEGKTVTCVSVPLGRSSTVSKPPDCTMPPKAETPLPNSSTT